MGRHPASLVKSSFSYFFQGTPAFEAAGTFERFIEDPEKWWEKSSRRKMYWFAKNGMSYDLGWEGDEYGPNESVNAFDGYSEKEKAIKIQDFIEKLEGIFD